MLFEGVPLRAVTLVETEYLDVVVVRTSEQVTAIREFDLSARFDEQFLVHLQVTRTDVETSDLVCKADD
jgi:hypothetical protein